MISLLKHTVTVWLSNGIIFDIVNLQWRTSNPIITSSIMTCHKKTFINAKYMLNLGKGSEEKKPGHWNQYITLKAFAMASGDGTKCKTCFWGPRMILHAHWKNTFSDPFPNTSMILIFRTNENFCFREGTLLWWQLVSATFSSWSISAQPTSSSVKTFMKSTIQDLQPNVLCVCVSKSHNWRACPV